MIPDCLTPAPPECKVIPDWLRLKEREVVFLENTVGGAPLESRRGELFRYHREASTNCKGKSPEPQKSPPFAVVLLLRPRGKESSAIFHLKNNQKKHLHTRGCSTCILPEKKEEPFISSCLTLIPKFQQATFYSTIKSQSKLRELRETTLLPTKIYAEWKLFASKEKSDRRQRAAH